MPTAVPDTITTREIKQKHDELASASGLSPEDLSLRLKKKNEASAREAWDYMGSSTAERVMKEGELANTVDDLFRAGSPRRTPAEYEAKLQNRFLINGYDNLQRSDGSPDNDGKQRLRDELRAKVLRDDQLAFYFRTLPNEAERTAYLESILRDHRYMRNVSSLLKDRIQMSPEDQSIKDKQKQAENDYQEAVDKLRGIEHQIKQKETVGSRTGRLEELAGAVRVLNGQVGAAQERINRATEALTAAQTAYDEMGDSESTDREERRAHEQRRLNASRLVARARAELQSAQTRYDTVNAQLTQAKQDRDRREDLLDTNDADIDLLRKQREDAQSDVRKANADVEEIKNRRSAFERDKLRQLEMITADAAASAIVESRNEATAYENEMLADIKNVQERQVMESVHKQIRETTDVKYVLDQIRDRGVLSLLEDGTLMPGVSYEAREAVMKDPEKLKRFQEQVIPLLFRKRIQGGKRLSRKEFGDFVDSPYVGRQVIEDAINNDRTFKALERSAIENGTVRGSILDQLKRLPKKQFLTIAMLILTGALAIGGVGLLGHWLLGWGISDKVAAFPMQKLPNPNPFNYAIKRAA